MTRSTFLTRSVAGLAIVLFTLAGCKKDDPVGPPPDPGQAITGSYSLLSIGGQNLPVTVEVGSFWVEQIIAGQIELTPSGRFYVSLHLRRVYSDGSIFTNNKTIPGSYTAVNNSILLQFDDGATRICTLLNGQMTLVDDNVEYRFRK